MTSEQLAAQKAATRDKKRYVRFKTDDANIVLTPRDAEQMIQDSDWDKYERSEVWLTDKEWESMNEY